MEHVEEGRRSHRDSIETNKRKMVGTDISKVLGL